MIDFMRYRWLYFLISAIVLIPGIFSLTRFGLKPSIDFTGGTVWEVQFSANRSLENEKPASITREKLQGVVQSQDTSLINIEAKAENRFILRLKPISTEQKQKMTTVLADEIGKFTEISYELVGPTLGRELLIKTITGVFLAALLILFYVAYRFKNKMFGVCAILAMLHDTLVILGSFSLLGHFWGVEVDTLFVTAVLTILSFSVHDTIVVYDRIRESLRKDPKAKFIDLTNKAVNETLTRSINNSLTIIFMLLALALLGGSTIRWFVAALLIGTISGTYSSTFTAAPLLVFWHGRLRGK